MFNLKTFSFVGLMIVALLGCQQNLEKETQQELKTAQTNEALKNEKLENKIKQAEPSMKKELTYRGTVKYFDFEGGFFGVITDNGENFLVNGLPKEYYQDGAIIEFSGKALKDMATIQQWGTLFKAEQYKLIKSGQKVPKKINPDLL